MADRDGLVLERVLSGAQTGVDRGALDAAIRLGVPHGGWCPRGRRAEDGVIPERYEVRETPSADYEQRTEWNVWDADATLIITEGPPSGGTGYTVEIARLAGRPCLVVDLLDEGVAGKGDAGQAPIRVREWLAGEGVRSLNVAGPRETKCPGIAGRAEQLIVDTLT